MGALPTAAQTNANNMGAPGAMGPSTSFDASTKQQNQLRSTDPTQIRLGSEGVVPEGMSRPSVVDGESHLHLTQQAEHVAVDS